MNGRRTCPSVPITSTQQQSPSGNRRPSDTVATDPPDSRASATMLSGSPGTGPSEDAAAATALTSSISCPVSQRIWSNSWTPMSTRIPPLRVRNDGAGGASSHCQQETCQSSPRSPAAMRRRSSTSSGTKRRQYPIWSRTPAAAAARVAVAVSAARSPHGFSHRIGTPAAANVSTSSTCRSVGAAIRTPSKPPRASSSATVEYTSTPSAATSLRMASTGSTTAVMTTVEPASARMCVRPIRPAPITARRNGSVALTARP